MAAIAALALVAYSNSFSGGFVFDNRGLILQDTRIRESSAENLALIIDHTYWWPYGESGLYRPLTTLSYLFNYAVLGNATDPWGYHALNFALHLLNVFLVWLLARRLLTQGAEYVAALWAVHPVLTESVTNIIGRADLLAGAAVLGGLLLYLKSAEATGGRRWAWLAALALTATAGAFAKESAVVVVGVIVLYELCWWRGRARALLLGVAATIPGIAWMLVQRASVLAASTSVVFPSSDNPLVTAGFWPARLTALKLIAHYVALLFWPVTLSCDYSYSQIALFAGTPADYAALAVVLLLVAAAVAMFRYNRVVFFCAAFAALAWLPTSNLLFPIGTIMAERFLYLPAIAAAVVVVLAVQALQRPKWISITLSILVALLVVRTWVRNTDWQSDVSLMTSAVDAAPASYKTHMALAAALSEAHGDAGRIVEEARRSLAILEPLPLAQRPAIAYYKTGEFLLAKGDGRGAMDAFMLCNQVVNAVRDHQAAIAKARGERAPGLDIQRKAELDRGISQAALLLGDAPRALAAARSAVDTNPLHPDGFRQLSAALLASGKEDDAAIALVEGVLATEDMTLRQDLVNFYRAGHDPSGCALSGAGLNPECPAVHQHACAAVAEALRLYMRAGLPQVARQMKESARAGSGCPPGGWDAIVP